MNLFTSKDKQTLLDKEIDNLINLMSEYKPFTDEYQKMTMNLEQLYKIRSLNKQSNKVSPDTVAIVSGNLAGIVLILTYEKLNVITTKALGFVIKGRV